MGTSDDGFFALNLIAVSVGTSLGIKSSILCVVITYCVLVAIVLVVTNGVVVKVKDGLLPAFPTVLTVVLDLVEDEDNDSNGLFVTGNTTFSTVEVKS